MQRAKVQTEFRKLGEVSLGSLQSLKSVDRTGERRKLCSDEVPEVSVGIPWKSVTQPGLYCPGQDKRDFQRASSPEKRVEQIN